jgi:hypothetical protein
MGDGTGLGHPVLDADNHYYEALDAFTRHLDPKLGPRVIQWSEINGRCYHVIGGRVNHAVTNPTFDPVALPGALHQYFRGNPDHRNPREFLSQREPIRPAYRDPAARLVALEEQGLAGCLLFPTLGMIYEEPLAHDSEAVCHLFRAFNRWMVEDWGFNHQDRIFAAPYITLADPDWAADELAWALDSGARVVVMRPAAPTTLLGRRNPFDPMFDGFWGLANEAGITVVAHASDSGGSSNGYAVDGFAATFSGGWKPSIKSFAIEQAIRDFLLTVIFESTSIDSQTSAWPRWRMEPSTSPICSRRSAQSPTRCPGIGRTIPSRPFANTSGSIPFGKTTSTRWPSAWESIGSYSVRTGPMLRRCPSRWTT